MDVIETLKECYGLAMNGETAKIDSRLAMIAKSAILPFVDSRDDGLISTAANIAELSTELRRYGNTVGLIGEMY